MKIVKIKDKYYTTKAKDSKVKDKIIFPDYPATSSYSPSIMSAQIENAKYAYKEWIKAKNNGDAKEQSFMMRTFLRSLAETEVYLQRYQQECQDFYDFTRKYDKAIKSVQSELDTLRSLSKEMK